MADDRTGLPIIPAQDAASDARANGYGWGDIQGAVDNASQAAQAAGYTQSEIDAHLGYSGTGGLSTRLADALQDDPGLNIVKPLGEPATFGGSPVLPEPGKSVGALTPDIAQHYADAVTMGEVRTPDDFGRSYLSTLGVTDPDHARIAGADLSRQLPTVEDLTDHALAIMHSNGEPLDAEGARTARTNLANYWAQTGQQPNAVLAERDPVIHDAMTTPHSFDPSTVPLPQRIEEAAGDVATAFGDNFMKGFGSPEAMTPETEQFFRDAGIFNQEGQYSPIRFANEVLFKTISSAFALTGAAVSGVAQGAGAAAEKVAEEAGVETPDRIGEGVTNAINFAGIEGGPAEVVPRAMAAGMVAKAAIQSADNGVLGAMLRDNSGALNVPEGWGLNPPKLPEGEKPALPATMPKLGGARAEKSIDIEPPPGIGHNQGPEGGEPPQPPGNTASPNFGKGGLVPSPGINPPNVRDVATNLEDELNRLRTNAQADKLKMMQFVSGLPEEWRDPKFQEDVSRQVEERLKGADTDLTVPESGEKFGPGTTPEVQVFLDHVKPFTDAQAGLLGDIRAKMAGIKGVDIDLDNMGIMTPDEGYVHRVVAGKEKGLHSPVDPDVERDVITGGRPRTLSTWASANQARAGFHVFQNEDGVRLWGTAPLSELDQKMGDTFDWGGDKWTIKPATMDEIEKNTAGTDNPIKYHKNFMANTADNILRLARVNRHLDFLGEQAKGLEQQGLFVKLNKDNAGRTPDGMTRVELPQMNGYAVPRIANVLNDFFKQKDDLENVLGRMNRFIMNSMFVTPAIHGGNVAAHWAVGSGWDLLNPLGYGKMAKAGVRAWRAVHELNDDFVNHLREGSGLMSASVETENFYKIMLHKLFNEQLGDENTWGDYARSLGLKGVKDLVNAELHWSKRTLWQLNDMFLLQRQIMLEGKGIEMREAIRQAEKDIPNYRVPSSVLFKDDQQAHALSQLLKSPNYAWFGRYHYGLTRGIYGLVRDAVGRSRTPQERWEAAGKMTAMGVMAMAGYPLVNLALQKITGNDNAALFNFGPFKVVNSLMGIGLSPEQSRLGAALGAIVSMSPLLEIPNMLKMGLDMFGRPLVSKYASVRNQMVEGMEAASKEFYAGQQALKVINGHADQALAGLIGVNVPTQYPATMRNRWQKRDQAIERARERKDPIMGWLDRVGVP